MTNAEQIEALRACGNGGECAKCPYDECSCPSVEDMMLAAADALEAAEQRIAELEDEIKNLENAYIAELTQAHINVQRSAKIYREWYEAVGRKRECTKNDLE